MASAGSSRITVVVFFVWCVQSSLRRRRCFHSHRGQDGWSKSQSETSVLVPQPQCDNSLSDVVRDVTATTESLQPDEKSRETVSACGTEPGIESCSCPVSDTAAVCDDQTSKGNLLCNGPPGSVTSHDSEVGSESGSYTASEASAVKVTYNGTDTDAKSSESGNCVRQVPAAVMKSDDAEAGSQSSSYQHSVTVVTDDSDDGSKSSSFQESEVPASTAITCDEDAGTKSHSNDTETETDAKLFSSSVGQVPDAAVMSDVTEAGSKSYSYQESETPASIVITCEDAGTKSHSNDIETEPDAKLFSSSVGQVPAAAVTSGDTQAGSKLSSYQESEAPASTVIAFDAAVCTESPSKDIETDAKLSGSSLSEVPSADVEAGSMSPCDQMNEEPYYTAVVKSADAEVSTKMSNCTVSEVPADAVTSRVPAIPISRDSDTGDSTNGSQVSEEPADAVRSRDSETSDGADGSKATASYVTAETGTEMDDSRAKDEPDAVMTSPAQEAGTESPEEHYVRHQLVTPQSKRRQFPRTNPACIPRNSSFDDALDQTMYEDSPETSSERSIDARLSVRSPLGGHDLSRERSKSTANVGSATAHVRHTSAPFSVNEPAAGPVSMNVRPTTMTTDLKSHLYHSGSVSMPSTPQQVG